MPYAVPTPVIVYLDTLAPVTGRWSDNTQTAELGGQSYADSLVTPVSSCSELESQSVEYNLSKGYRMLTGPDVTGVLRLKIVMTPADTDDNEPCSYDNIFAIGNAQLHGLANEIPRVTDTPTN